VAPTPLHLVAGLAERLDPGVGRDDRGDLGPQRLVGRPRERRSQVGSHPGGHVGEQPPLAAGLTHSAGQLGAEDDAAFGGGLGAAALLLVAGGDRQQEYVVALHQHLASQDQVLVDPQWHPTQGGGDPGRVGQHVEEVAARQP
jgi:hypothetical protein